MPRSPDPVTNSRARQLPLGVRTTLLVLAVGLTLWSLLDRWQTDHMDKVITDEITMRLQSQAHENRMRFDERIHEAHAYVRLLEASPRAQRALADELGRAKGAPARVAGPPDWLLERPVGRVLWQPDVLHLLDKDFQPKVSYALTPVRDLMEARVLDQRTIALSAMEPQLVRAAGALWLLSAAEVKGQSGRPVGWLTGMTKIGDQFLHALGGAISDQGVVAIIGGRPHVVIASSDPDLVPAGTRTSDLPADFLVTGKGFFDYGFSETDAGVATLIPRSTVSDKVAAVLTVERKQRTLMASGVAGLFLLTMLYMTLRIRRMTRHVANLSERVFGRRCDASGHDELDDLKRQVELLTEEVVASRAALEQETQAKLDLLSSHNLYLKQARVDLKEEVRLKTRELRSAMLKAQAATEAKSRFLAAASHDLRQPFQAMRLYLDVLAGKEMESSGLLVVEKLDAAMRSGEELLTALLDVSTLDAGMVRVTVDRVALGQVIASVLEECEAQAAAKGLRLRSVATTATVVSDPVLLRRMVRNLVINAIRYTAQGTVLVGCRRREGGIRLEVWDTGIGIPWNLQRRIFEDFYQIGNPARDKSNGLGLGLGVVSRMSELLRHPVGVRSTPGRGSAFWIDFGGPPPVAFQTAGPELAPEPASVRAGA